MRIQNLKSDKTHSFSLPKAMYLYVVKSIAVVILWSQNVNSIWLLPSFFYWIVRNNPGYLVIVGTYVYKNGIVNNHIIKSFWNSCSFLSLAKEENQQTMESENHKKMLLGIFLLWISSLVKREGISKNFFVILYPIFIHYTLIILRYFTLLTAVNSSIWICIQ